MKILRPKPMPTAAELFTLIEQADYLEGVLHDPRSKQTPGNQGRAFWRGVIEASGWIGFNSYPRLVLQGSYEFLNAFLEFMERETAEGWDEGGKLAFQASGGKLLIAGKKAQEVCQALYIGESVGREEIREKVDRIITWVGAGR